MKISINGSGYVPDFDLIKKKLKSPVIIDGHNLYDPQRMAQRGFNYFGIGRGNLEK